MTWTAGGAAWGSGAAEVRLRGMDGALPGRLGGRQARPQGKPQQRPQLRRAAVVLGQRPADDVGVRGKGGRDGRPRKGQVVGGHERGPPVFWRVDRSIFASGRPPGGGNSSNADLGKTWGASGDSGVVGR